jgi:hypothetical protein
MYRWLVFRILTYSGKAACHLICRARLWLAFYEMPRDAALCFCNIGLFHNRSGLIFTYPSVLVVGQTHQGFLHFLNVLNWPLGVVEFWNLYYVMTWMAEHVTHRQLLWMADDGSSVADCWATWQVATELLGIPSLFEKIQAQLQNITSRIFPVLKRGSEMEASLDQVLCMWCIVMGVLLWKLKVRKQKQGTCRG